MGLHLLPPGMKPCIADLDEPVIHLYLVDANLQILLAQRTVTLNEKFHQLLQKKVQEQLESSITPGAFVSTLQEIWKRRTSKAMSEDCLVNQKVELSIPLPKRMN